MRALAGLIALAVVPVAGHAQKVQQEGRVDLIGPAPYALHAGVGVVEALGTYVRVSAGVGWGLRPPHAWGEGEWRGDLLARLTLDPFRQQRWGFSVGGGVTVRDRAYLAALLDLEGPATRGIVPAVQLGVGGGLRAGLVIRRAMTGRR